MKGVKRMNGKQIPLIKPNINYENTSMETIEPITGKYRLIGESIGKLVDEKNRAYGDSFNKSADFLKILYPNGVQPNQYGDMLGVVRIFDKLMRIATDKEGLGENPFRDIAGYDS
jgi:hypothetical protein